jgi:hypothetical protein
VREHLEANQAHAFAAACRLLDGDDAPALRRRLGLPGNARPLGRAEPPAAAVSATTAAPRPRVATPEPPDNSGQRVFRVRRLEVGKAFGALVVGSVTAFFALAFAGAVGAKALGFTGPPFARLLGWIAAVSAALGVGAASRHLRVRTSCSDPACSGAPGLRDASCPACHGQIAGTIRHRDERLDAEEALTDGTGGGTPGA